MTTQPPAPDALARLEQRLERIEQRLDKLVSVLDEATPTIAMASDTFDDWAAEQAARGLDLDERAGNAMALAELLTEPHNAAVLTHVMRSLPKLESSLTLLATFDDTLGMVFDMFDAQVAQLQRQGIDPEQRFVQVGSLLRRVTDPEFHGHLERLLDAAPGLMAATQTGELFGRAIDEVRADDAPAHALDGPMGLDECLVRSSRQARGRLCRGGGPQSGRTPAATDASPPCPRTR